MAIYTTSLRPGTTSSFSSGEGGGIIQMVSTTKTDVFSTTSGSWVDITGLSLTITPESTSNKVLCVFSVNYSNSGNSTCRISIFNGSTNLLGSDVSSRFRGLQMYQPDANTGEVAAFQFLHSPSTTSAYTYKLRMAIQGFTGYLNRSGTDADNSSYGYRGACTFTLMEVSG